MCCGVYFAWNRCSKISSTASIKPQAAVIARFECGSLSLQWHAALLFSTAGLQALGSDVELKSTTVFNIFAKFLYVFGASLIVGLTFGLGTAVLLKLLKSNSAPQASTSAQPPTFPRATHSVPMPFHSVGAALCMWCASQDGIIWMRIIIYTCADSLL